MFVSCNECWTDTEFLPYWDLELVKFCNHPHPTPVYLCCEFLAQPELLYPAYGKMRMCRSVDV